MHGAEFCRPLRYRIDCRTFCILSCPAGLRLHLNLQPARRTCHCRCMQVGLKRECISPSRRTAGQHRWPAIPNTQPHAFQPCPPHCSANYVSNKGSNPCSHLISVLCYRVWGRLSPRLHAVLLDMVYAALACYGIVEHGNDELNATR